MNGFDKNSINAQLATIIERQENNHTSIIKRLDEGAATMKEHDKRIQSLEGSRKWVLGFFGAITSILEYLHWKKG